jgi:quercetin dioxygenase-like cupin family protein
LEPPSGELPPFVPEFLVTRGGQSGEGRAGMHYRDLIPGRLGGRYIASHITIPEGGPVSDWVHFHRIAVQMIYVRSGWVRVIYEDQGAPFVMNVGDLVLQPPGIRHRVLESSSALEVVEITAPALHETLADHDLALPSANVDSARLFDGQRFLHHVAAETAWAPLGDAEVQQTGVSKASAGLADVRTFRMAGADEIHFSPHDGELVFGFVLEGTARLNLRDIEDLGPADAFVIPPNDPWRLSSVSPDFRLLQVTTSRL